MNMGIYGGKKVVVTGASGLIGSYVIKNLSGAGAGVTRVIHTRTPNKYTKLAGRLIKDDLCNFNEARKVVNSVDVVLNSKIAKGTPQNEDSFANLVISKVNVFHIYHNIKNISGRSK
jgi:nucleoside-diphosphate-sugar epimerase